MTDALFEVPVVTATGCSQAGTVHEHRWIRFGKAGERTEEVVPVDVAGNITLTADNGAEIELPEQFVGKLMREAGWVQADPDPAETAWARRKAWARSRLQDSLNAALNRRAD